MASYGRIRKVRKMDDETRRYIDTRMNELRNRMMTYVHTTMVGELSQVTQIPRGERCRLGQAFEAAVEAIIDEHDAIVENGIADVIHQTEGVLRQTS